MTYKTVCGFLNVDRFQHRVTCDMYMNSERNKSHKLSGDGREGEKVGFQTRTRTTRGQREMKESIGTLRETTLMYIGRHSYGGMERRS